MENKPVPIRYPIARIVGFNKERTQFMVDSGEGPKAYKTTLGLFLDSVENKDRSLRRYGSIRQFILEYLIRMSRLYPGITVRELIEQLKDF